MRGVTWSSSRISTRRVPGRISSLAVQRDFCPSINTTTGLSPVRFLNPACSESQVKISPVALISLLSVGTTGHEPACIWVQDEEDPFLARPDEDLERALPRYPGACEDEDQSYRLRPLPPASSALAWDPAVCRGPKWLAHLSLASSAPLWHRLK